MTEHPEQPVSVSRRYGANPASWLPLSPEWWPELFRAANLEHLVYLKLCVAGGAGGLAAARQYAQRAQRRQ